MIFFANRGEGSIFLTATFFVFPVALAVPQLRRCNGGDSAMDCPKQPPPDYSPLLVKCCLLLIIHGTVLEGDCS